MSFKRFDLDKDVFFGEGFLEEKVSFSPYLLSISGAYTDDDIYRYKGSNRHVRFNNCYVSGGISGSFNLDLYDGVPGDFGSSKLLSYTYGHTTSSIRFSGTGFVPTHQDQKVRMYRMMAKRLLGSENSIFISDGKEINEAFFVCLSRNQYKDGLKHGNFYIYFYADSEAEAIPSYPSLTVLEKQNILYSQNSSYSPLTLTHMALQTPGGLVFHQAGVAVIDVTSMRTGSNTWSGSYNYDVLAKGVSGTTYNDLLWGCMSRVHTIGFESVSKVVSSYFTCRAAKSEFNYSSNPSFLNREGQNLTNVSSSLSTTFFTTIALLGENQEVLAIAKLKEPLKKDARTNFEIIVRLDT